MGDKLSHRRKPMETIIPRALCSHYGIRVDFLISKDIFVWLKDKILVSPWFDFELIYGCRLELLPRCYHTHLQTDYKINLRQHNTCFSQSTFAKNRFARFMCHGFLHGCAYKCLASARRENQRSKNAYMHSAARSEWIARLLRRGLKLTLREDAFCSGRCKACVSQGSERARCQVRRKAEADAGQYAERCQRGVQKSFTPSAPRQRWRKDWLSKP